MTAQSPADLAAIVQDALDLLAGYAARDESDFAVMEDGGGWVIESATHERVAEPYYFEDDAPLIAAAPDMAALLIQCEEALEEIASPCAAKAREGQPHPSAIARAVLARLADFDRSLWA